MAEDILPSEIPFLSGTGIVATDYTFDASAKTVVVASADYKRMLYIVNTTHGTVIYNLYNKDLSGTLGASGVTLDFDTTVYMNDADDLLVLYEGDRSEYPYTHDYIAVTYPTSTTEVFTYRDGGAGGTIVATTTITYTDDSKCDISTIVRA